MRGGPAPESEQAIGLDEAMDMVRGFIDTRNLKPAIDLLDHIVATVTDNAQVWSYLAVANFHVFGAAKCREILERAIVALPDDPNLRNNLGNACAELGDVKSAIEAYEKAIELDPRHAEAFCNLASIMKHGGNPGFAEKLLRTAIHIKDDFGLAYQNLAALLLSEGRALEAIDYFWKATVYLPRPAMPMQLMALAYWHAGLKQEATDFVRKWADSEPDDPQARHLLAAFTGENVPDRADSTYVADLFDKFAHSFDSKLDDLEYRAPEIVAAAVAAAVGEPSEKLTVLDAGCGTGKCAKFLRPFADRLVGVDLSKGMIAKAERLNLYDALVVEELTAFVARHAAAFDVIASADTLCYFGRLDEFCRAVRGALAPGGKLVFTVEAMKDDSLPFRLAVHGRYEHSEAYVRGCLTNAGLEVEKIGREKLRKENAQPVIGLVVTAARSL